MGSRFRITADVVIFSDSALQVTLTHAESISWRTSNSHGQYLSSDKICQASPGEPEVTEKTASPGTMVWNRELKLGDEKKRKGQ